jgi:hypothetical protein
MYVIFWGRDKDGVKVFHIQEKVIHFISGVNTCDSCRHYVMEYCGFTPYLGGFVVYKKKSGNFNIMFIFMTIIQGAKLIYVPKGVIQLYFRKEL